MSEYIKREDALRQVMMVETRENMYRCMKNIPAADVRPVVRGKWVEELHQNVRYYQYKCSVCGEFSGHDSEGWIWEPDFCPNCGAMMEES